MRERILGIPLDEDPAVCLKAVASVLNGENRRLKDPQTPSKLKALILKWRTNGIYLSDTHQFSKDWRVYWIAPSEPGSRIRALIAPIGEDCQDEAGTYFIRLARLEKEEADKLADLCR